MTEAPRTDRDSRATRIRKLMKKEARLYRSPVRWILFFATMVPALIEFVQVFALNSTALLGGVVLAIGPAATFGRRRRVRGALAFLILLAAAVIQQESRTPWTGTILLVAAVGLIGRAIFGPEATLPVPRSSRPPPSVPASLLLASPFRWVAVVAALGCLAVCFPHLGEVETPSSRDWLLTALVLGLLAAPPAAFAPPRIAREIACIFLTLAGVGVLFLSPRPAFGLGPILAAGLLKILDASTRRTRIGEGRRGPPRTLL